MPTSALRQRLNAALLDFAWDEWAQMGVLATPGRRSPWAQDPEALLLLTLELARDDPRLFDEVLDWLGHNEPVVSTRRLRSLCEDCDDERLVSATLNWVAGRRGRQPPRPPAPGDRAPEPLFRGLSAPVRSADAAFLAHGLLRPEAIPSGKSRDPDLTLPINFAFRLRHLLGVSARAETVRFLLTSDVQSASVAAVASSGGYAKRNVQEALRGLHAAGAVSVIAVGAERRYRTDRAVWAHLLGSDASDLPIHRDWPQLLGALRRMLRWLARPELARFSEYLLASQARDLLDEIHPRLAQAGVVTAASRGGDTGWKDLVETVERTLVALDPGNATVERSADFEVYADATRHHRWRLNATNGRIVATSSESYASRASAKVAAERLRSNPDSYEYVIDVDEAGNYRWRASAADGQNIAASGESFASRHDAERAARGARDLAASAAGP